MENALTSLAELGTSQASFIWEEEIGSQETFSGAPGAGVVAFKNRRLAPHVHPAEFFAKHW